MARDLRIPFEAEIHSSPSIKWENSVFLLCIYNVPNMPLVVDILIYMKYDPDLSGLTV